MNALENFKLDADEGLFPVVSRSLALPGYILLFLMLVYPMVLQLLYVKAFLFACVLIIVTVGMFSSRRRSLDPTVVLWTLSLAAVSSFFVLLGLYYGTPGAAKAAQVYILWPLIYMVIIAGVTHFRILDGLQKTLIVGSICVGLQGFLYLLTALNILPDNKLSSLVTFEWEAQSIGLHEGYVGMQFPGLNSLPFLLPFIMASLVTRRGKSENSAVSRAGMWAALILGLAITLISGRRALILLMLIAPLFIWIFSSFQLPEAKRHSRKSLLRLTLVVIVALVAMLIGSGSIHEINLPGIVERVSQGFDFGPNSLDDSGPERREQYVALLHGWVENPLFGAGHGASAYRSIRSAERPWEYELFYLALLYQTGLVGFLSYAAGVGWIYWTGSKIIKQGGKLGPGMLSLLVGMSSYLTANAVDPYVARFDGMWAIFLPLAFINYWLGIKCGDYKCHGQLAVQPLRQA
jgi:O-antigen ligase